MHEVVAAVLTKEQIESIQRHQADPDLTPQIAGAAVQIIEAGRKVLLAGQPDKAADTNAAADYLGRRFLQAALNTVWHHSQELRRARPA